MNKYEAFYNGKRTTVEADTSFEAQKQAAKFWGVPEQKRWKVSVLLIKLGEEDVKVDPASL